MSLPEDVPPAAEVPKIIRERQGRVMLGVLTVAVAVALGVTGNWWIRRVGAESSAIAARGNLAVGRGDFANGLALLASLESTRAPVPLRLAAVRDAAIGSWIGVVSTAAADSALTRVRSTVPNATGLDAAELHWLDGVIAIASGDSARVFRAAAAITDTGRTARRLPASLRALWYARRTENVDRLIAEEDSAMVSGEVFAPVALVHGLAIGRGLTRAGDPGKAEHYLQWMDASGTDARATGVTDAFGSYNSYQRGVAFDAAGDRAHAILHLGRFVDMVDRPPASMRSQVEDAKARLARLAGDAGK